MEGFLGVWGEPGEGHPGRQRGARREGYVLCTQCRPCSPASRLLAVQRPSGPNHGTCVCEAGSEDRLFPFRVGPWFWLSPEANTTEQSESSPAARRRFAGCAAALRTQLCSAQAAWAEPHLGLLSTLPGSPPGRGSEARNFIE